MLKRKRNIYIKIIVKFTRRRDKHIERNCKKSEKSFFYLKVPHRLLVPTVFLTPLRRRTYDRNSFSKFSWNRCGRPRNVGRRKGQGRGKLEIRVLVLLTVPIPSRGIQLCSRFRMHLFESWYKNLFRSLAPSLPRLLTPTSRSSSLSTFYRGRRAPSRDPYQPGHVPTYLCMYDDSLDIECHELSGLLLFKEARLFLRVLGLQLWLRHRFKRIRLTSFRFTKRSRKRVEILLSNAIEGFAKSRRKFIVW